MIDFKKITNSVEVENEVVSWEEIVQISEMKRIVGLCFTNCPITDRDIKQLCKLPKLVNVTLENTQITDKSLEYLAQLPKLQYLFITKANITGKGFSHFASHQKVDTIWANETQLDDENFKYLIEIPKLSILVIHNTKVSFEGLMSAVHSPRLKVISNNFTEKEIHIFKTEQRQQAKKKKEVNEDDVKEATKVLLTFFEAMTDWEQWAGKDDRLSSEEAQKRCQKVFEKYCTNKNRGAYRPNGLYISNAPHYSYKSFKIIDVEQITNNKLYIYTEDYLDFEYRFLLIQKENQWKVDEGYWKDGSWKKYGL